MEPEPKFLNIAAYGPDRNLFLVVLKTKNVPGALGDIATRAGNASMNILSTSNYSLPDHPESVLSFFAESKDPKMSEDDMAKVFHSSPFVLDLHTEKKEAALLIDDFSFPLMFFPSGRGILLPQSGTTAMFRDLVRLFGTGGETIIYNAGASVGRKGFDELTALLGKELTIEVASSFTKLYAAVGWGRLEMGEIRGGRYEMRLFDGFESAGARSSRPICHFTRGLIAGAFERVLKGPVKVTEEQCAATGAPGCLFAVTLKDRPQ
ncbi:MAG: hypothetical protein JRN08_03485 [Nitrososphaerota archaeon]|nr:hypothetical protein [Nitrososphaerota archaeon]